MQTPQVPRPWRQVLREQGRSLTWLAAHSGRSTRTVYAYSRGELHPTEGWLVVVSQVLGEPVR